MNLKMIARGAGAALLLLNAAAAAAAPMWEGHEAAEDGILTVYNPANPLTPRASVIEPVPMWRIGGDDDPAGTLFGLVTDAVPSGSGSTWVLDAVLSTVYEVGPDGGILRTVGREGDGPGEFRNAMSLAALPDGGVGVVEMMPGQMVVFGADGLPRPTVRLGPEGGQSLSQTVSVQGDHMIMGFVSTRFDAGDAHIEHILGDFALDGTERHRILSTSETQSGGSISFSSGGEGDFVNNWVAGPDGTVYVHRRNYEYLIESFAPDGTPLRRIRREYETLKLPDEDIAAQREQRERMRERFHTEATMEIEERARDISEVVPRPDGSLWVLTSRGSRERPDGSLGVFDVIDPAGRFAGQVRVDADYDPDDDEFLIRGDRLYVLKEARNAPDRTFSGGGGMMMIQLTSGAQEDDEDDEDPAPYEVICYRLP